MSLTLTAIVRVITPLVDPPMSLSPQAVFQARIGAPGPVVDGHLLLARLPESQVGWTFVVR